MRRSGTGIHPYWWLRLIFLFLTVVLPIGVLMYLSQNNSELLSYPNMMWVIFGWLIYMIISIVIMLRIESVLEKRKNNNTSNIIIQNTSMTDEQRETFENVMSQLNIIMNNKSNSSKNVADINRICPKCNSINTTKMNSGKYICLECEHKF